MDVKHPGMILAVHRDLIDKVLHFKQGINDQVDIMDFGRAAKGYFVLKRRHELEQTSEYRQILPYLLLANTNEETLESMYWAYPRTAAGGEAALHGKVSVGVGGHVDMNRLYFDQQSVLQFFETVERGYVAEGDEEVMITDESGVRWTVDQILESRPSEFIGFMVDNGDEVGTKHLAVVTVLHLGEGWKVVSNEPDIGAPRLATVVDLLDGDQRGEFQLEGWSRIIMEHIRTCDTSGYLLGNFAASESITAHAREALNVAVPPEETTQRRTLHVKLDDNDPTPDKTVNDVARNLANVEALSARQAGYKVENAPAGFEDQFKSVFGEDNKNQ